MAKHCPKAKKQGRKSGRKGGSRSGPRTCYFCDNPGHMKVECPEKEARLERKFAGTPAEVDSDMSASDDGAYLCTVAKAARATPPRIYIDVQASGVNAGMWAWARPTVDTCASFTMVTAEFLQQHRIEYSSQPRASVL